MNHFFYLENLDRENTVESSVFAIFYLLHTWGQWFWVGVFLQHLLLSNLFEIQLYSLTKKEANIFFFEILEGPLFIESKENDLADPPLSKSIAI